jgi:hypothetical protein
LSDPIEVHLRPARPPLLGLSPEALLGSALVEAVRYVLKDELAAQREAASAPPKSPWMTPPAAARVTGVPVKSIRAWARSGRVSKRLKNRSADPKQQKFLVNIEEVIAVAERSEAAGPRGGLQERAQARVQEILDARTGTGR